MLNYFAAGKHIHMEKPSPVSVIDIHWRICYQTEGIIIEVKHKSHWLFSERTQSRCGNKNIGRCLYYLPMLHTTKFMLSTAKFYCFRRYIHVVYIDYRIICYMFLRENVYIYVLDWKQCTPCNHHFRQLPMKLFSGVLRSNWYIP